MFLALALVLAQPQTMDAGAVERGSAMGLTTLLSETERLQVVGGAMRQQFLPGKVYQVSWWTKPRLSGAFCERQLFGRQLNGGNEEKPRSYAVEDQPNRVQFALAGEGECTDTAGWASPLPGQIAVSLSAMQAFAEVRRLAAGGDKLPFAIACQDEVAKPSICDRPRETLAMLAPGRMGTPRIEPQAYRQDAPNIRTALPPQAGEPVVAVIPFSPGMGDARTTFVSLRMEAGRVVAVELRRSTVIYH
ncbi:hypothetical protein GCM10022280_13300 [Sphingomonas swuensis]|uniref:DUF3108 domain-containing protein n=1 Tax=Sphingomonas swuensis TaxID=977800 RepID=A0ABP7SSS9_9SPHN